MHDLRCTGSTILNGLGSDSDWIEKCFAHEDGRSSRDVYNKAEYALRSGWSLGIRPSKLT